MEYDEIATSGSIDQKKGNGGGNGNNGNGKFNKTKKKRKKDYIIVNDIQDKPYFEWPMLMGENPAVRDKKLKWSYHKYHVHRTKNYFTFEKHLTELAESLQAGSKRENAKKEN